MHYLDTPIGSSQESTWTQYTVSTQSSQEELPESLQLSHDWTASFVDKHQLLDLGTRVNVHLSSRHKAAAEFCKMSGLLCCYGLYQVRLGCECIITLLTGLLLCSFFLRLSAKTSWRYTAEETQLVSRFELYMCPLRTPLRVSSSHL